MLNYSTTKIGGARAGETLEGKAGEFRGNATNLSPTPTGGIDLGFFCNLVCFFFFRQHLPEALIFFYTADILLLSLSAVETGVHYLYNIYTDLTVSTADKLLVLAAFAVYFFFPQLFIFILFFCPKLFVHSCGLVFRLVSRAFFFLHSCVSVVFFSFSFSFFFSFSPLDRRRLELHSLGSVNALLRLY